MSYDLEPPRGMPPLGRTVCGNRCFSGHVCTRPEGHDGDHIARNRKTRRVLNRWPAAPKEEP